MCSLPPKRSSHKGEGGSARGEHSSGVSGARRLQRRPRHHSGVGSLRSQPWSCSLPPALQLFLEQMQLGAHLRSHRSISWLVANRTNNLGRQRMLLERWTTPTRSGVRVALGTGYTRGLGGRGETAVLSSPTRIPIRRIKHITARASPSDLLASRSEHAPGGWSHCSRAPCATSPVTPRVRRSASPLPLCVTLPATAPHTPPPPASATCQVSAQSNPNRPVHVAAEGGALTALLCGVLFSGTVSDMRARACLSSPGSPVSRAVCLPSLMARASRRALSPATALPGRASCAAVRECGDAGSHTGPSASPASACCTRTHTRAGFDFGLAHTRWTVSLDGESVPALQRCTSCGSASGVWHGGATDNRP